MDFSWSKEQIELKKKAVEFGATELNRGLPGRDLAGTYSRDAWSAACDFGVLGWPLPEKYGGQGLDLRSTVLAFEGLGEGCEDNGLLFSIGAQVWSMQLPILIFGTEAQREKYLPPLIRGEIIGAHAVSEPEAGSDIQSMQATVEKRGDRYILNAHKTWCTSAPISEVFLVTASQMLNGKRELTTFLLDRDTPGLSTRGPMEKMGMRTAQMGEVILENVEIPESARLGAEGAGFSIFTSSMEWERAFILSTALGSMQRNLDLAIRHARTRKQFGQPIGKNQAVAHKIVEMRTQLETARLHLYRCAWMKDARKRLTIESSETKLVVSEAWVASCEHLMQIHGASGYMVEKGIERQLRDSLASRIYSGTSEIQKVIMSAWLGL